MQLVETPYGAHEFVAQFKEEHVQWDLQNGTDMDDQGVSGDLGDATPALRHEIISHIEAFVRAPANCDERDGAQIETRRPTVKLVETEPFLTDTYRKKRLCVDVGRASSADAATLQSA